MEATQVSMMDKWMNKMWYIHTIKYYSALKRGNSDICYYIDEPWRHHAKWNKPITKNTNTIWFHSYEVPRIIKFIEIESWMVVARGCKKGRMRYYSLMGAVLLWEDEKFLEIVMIAAHQYEWT